MFKYKRIPFKTLWIWNYSPDNFCDTEEQTNIFCKKYSLFKDQSPMAKEFALLEMIYGHINVKNNKFWLKNSTRILFEIWDLKHMFMGFFLRELYKIFWEFGEAFIFWVSFSLYKLIWMHFILVFVRIFCAFLLILRGLPDSTKQLLAISFTSRLLNKSYCYSEFVRLNFVVSFSYCMRTHTTRHVLFVKSPSMLSKTILNESFMSFMTLINIHIGYISTQVKH
ncbi:hypothetical protein ACJX0J_007152, partial [Zea mays]